VPRHPQRFDEVAALAAQRWAARLRRSAWPTSAARSGERADVWVGDSMGEMPLYYAAGRRGPAGRQLCAIGRAEPDRGRRLRLPAADGAAHLQLCPLAFAHAHRGAAERMALEVAALLAQRRG
jgi:3-deoxy-D-manno-octulosonic-acid transferase